MNMPLFEGLHKAMCSECYCKGVLICCDYCCSSYHPRCLTPPLVSQPMDYWMCPQCVTDSQSPKGSYVIQQRNRAMSYPSSNGETVNQELSETPMSIRKYGRMGRHGSVDLTKSSMKKGTGSSSANHVYTSGYRGVYSRSGKWNAQIQYNGKKVYLGSYSSEEEAAHAYDVAANRFHGCKAVLNFQTSDEGDCRNPFQVNSKQTNRKGSVGLSGEDYGDTGMGYMVDHSESEVTYCAPADVMPSIQNIPASTMDLYLPSLDVFPVMSPVIYASHEEVSNILRENRKGCSFAI